jgi:predicted ATPase/Tfp pilus assembly protein PilF
MGLHTGHAQLRDDDYYGPVVNQAVRIQEIAHGGQILLSQATQMIAREELPMELSLIDLGQQHVRDFPRPERIYQLSWPGLDKTFPPLKSLPKKRSNLPEQATKLVGRKDELADINKLLADPDTRLVTIIGPGGMGKTRFSVAAAEQQLAAANFSEGIIFISLAPLADVDQVPAAMADALSLPLEAGTRQQRTPRQQVLDFLRNKEMLLVLDNFEHLLEGVDLVYEILQEAPQVKIVTTSRERLQLRSEQLYPIMGLEFSERELTAKETVEYTAVKLLLQRVRQVQPGFNPTEEDMAVLSRICRLVEGMPLALELAAGWVDVLSLDDIASEIQQSLNFLETDARDVPQRQRSIRVVFDNSWKRLNAAEQDALAQFSIFRGGFNMKAARQISGVSLRTLHKLANKSLLQYDAVKKRYQIHELLRQYGGEKLRNNRPGPPGVSAEAAIRDRHSAYYCSFLKEMATNPDGQGRDVALAEITADISNIYSAWHWAIERADLEVISGCVEGLSSFFLRRGPLHEGDKLLDLAAVRLQEILDSKPVGEQKAAVVLSRIQANRASILNRSGQYEEAIAQARSALHLAQTHGAVAGEAMANLQWGRALWFQGNYEAAHPILEKAIDRSRASANTVVEAESIRRLGAIYWPRGQYEKAIDYFEQALTLYKKLGNRHGEALTLNNLGLIALEQGHLITAKKYMEQAVAINRQINDKGGEGRALTNLGNACWQLGLFDEALAHNEEGLLIHQELGIKRGEAYSLNNRGVMLAGVGDFAQAKSLYEEAHQIYRQYGELRGQSIVLANLGLLANDDSDWQAALRFANHSLELAQKVGVRRNIAEALNLIGRIQADTGDLTGAEQMYREALTIRQELGHAAAAMEPLAGLADIARVQGDLVRSKLYLQQILDYLETGNLQGATNQLRLFLTCYRVLASLRDRRDVEILQAAYQLLQDRLNQISDPRLHQTFVKNIKVNREILDAYKQRVSVA